MDDGIIRVLPYILLLGRISAFFLVLPIFGWKMLPVYIRTGIILLMTAFFAIVMPLESFDIASKSWLVGGLAVIQEIAKGLVLGLLIGIVFQAVSICGQIVAQQMAMMDAGVISPSGHGSQSVAILLQMTFVVCFLHSGAHEVFFRVLVSSYQIFPVNAGLDIAAVAEGLVTAGSTMFLFALKLAAPVLAAFAILSIALAILARVLPEMNMLLVSFPVRVALGLLMASLIMPSLQTFVWEMVAWIQGHLAI